MPLRYTLPREMGAGLLLLMLCSPLWAAKKVDLDYHVRLLPHSNQAEVRLTLAEGSVVRSLDFDLGVPGSYSDFKADGAWQLTPDPTHSRGLWHPAPGKAESFKWLPPTCGYRLVSERKDLPLWHHLVCGDPDAVHHERISQSGRMLAEGSVPEEDWEDHLIFRAG